MDTLRFSSLALVTLLLVGAGVLHAQNHCLEIAGPALDVDSGNSAELVVRSGSAMELKGDLGYRLSLSGGISEAKIPRQSEHAYEISVQTGKLTVCDSGVAAAPPALSPDATRAAGEKAPASVAPPSASGGPVPTSSAPPTVAGTPDTKKDSAVGAKGATPDAGNGTKTSAGAPANSGTSCFSAGTKTGEKCDIRATIDGLAAPQEPGFAVLGVTPETVIRPQSPAQLASALINGFDKQGNFQTGMAMEAVPFLWIAGHNFALSDYIPDPKRNPPPSSGEKAKAYLIRLATRTSVSFASAKGVNPNDTAVRLGLGVRSVLFQKNDPHTNFYECISMFPIASVHPGPGTKPTEAGAETFDQAVTRCQEDGRKQVWNSTSWVVAGASSWISLPGGNGYRINGGGYWSSFAWGFTSNAQIIFNAQRRTGEYIPGPSSGTTSGTNTDFVMRDSTAFGGELRYGGYGLNGFLEGLWIGQRIARATNSYGLYGLGAEKKISDALYLDLTYRWAPGTSSNKSSIIGNLNWSFNQKPQMVPQ